MLTFSEAEHTYAWDGQSVPSVTQILADMGMSPDYRYVDAWYAERGKAVHWACHAYDEGDLDFGSLDERIIEYVNAWIAFRSDMGDRLRFAEIEQPRYHAVHRYAGTPDRLAWLDDVPAVLDLKCGGHDPSHGLQLSGYSLLWSEPAAKRFGVYLRDDGRYKLEPYTERSDGPTFLAATACWWWRHYRNRLPKE